MVSRNLVLATVLFVGVILPACGGKPTPDVQAIETQTAVRIFATQTADVSGPTRISEPTATSMPCSVQSQEFITQAQTLLEEWNDINQIAGKTGRIALNQPVSQLQSIRRQLDGKVAPECASGMKVVMNAYMNATVDVYLAFMGQASDMDMSFKTGKAAALGTLLQESLNRITHDETVVAYPVRYQVGGVANFGVTYTPAPSVSLGPRYVDDSWSESSVALNKQVVVITVKNQMMSGEAFCEIWVNGTLVKRETSSEPRGEFSCIYTMP